MLRKYSELDIYEDFINGNLEPKKLNGSQLRSIPKYLNEELEECRDMILGKFKKDGRKRLLIEKIKISSAHPLAEEYFNNELSLFENDSLIPKEVLDQLDIDKELTSDQTILKKQENFSLIGVTVESEWEELENDRLKYCYINLILHEHIRKIKIKLRSDFFSTKKEEARRLVAAVQSILKSYLNDILDQYKLKESDLQIKVKKNYSDKDCAALIYLSIIDLHNFIFNHFYELMDQKQIVPFYASVANENEFVSSAKKILKSLKKIDMDEALYSFVQDKLEKVLNINVSSRITYKEISYFNHFLKSFSRYLEKNKYYPITEDQIIYFLIGHNFNDFIFCDYLEKRIKSELMDYDNFHDMKMLLIRKKTELNQITTITNEKLVPDREDVLSLILKWIDIELDYVNTIEENNKDPYQDQTPNHVQLVANMKVSELTLLIKTLYEKDHIKSSSINELASWMQVAFRTQKNEPLSIQNIRNNFYDPSPRAMEKVKEIGIQIMNEFKMID